MLPSCDSYLEFHNDEEYDRSDDDENPSRIAGFHFNTTGEMGKNFHSAVTSNISDRPAPTLHSCTAGSVLRMLPATKLLDFILIIFLAPTTLTDYRQSPRNTIVLGQFCFEVHISYGMRHRLFLIMPR